MNSYTEEQLELLMARVSTNLNKLYFEDINLIISCILYNIKESAQLDI